jgi:hypothetical protein
VLLYFQELLLQKVAAEVKKMAVSNHTVVAGTAVKAVRFMESVTAEDTVPLLETCQLALSSCPTGGTDTFFMTGGSMIVIATDL